MKKIFAILLFTLGAQAALGASLHPCTPTVQAVPTQISCLAGELRYEIVVKTLMSPAQPYCTGENYFEYKTATVKILQDGSLKQQLTIPDGSFTYQLMDPTSFTSTDYNLDLKDCVTPVFGGASIGNY